MEVIKSLWLKIFWVLLIGFVFKGFLEGVDDWC